MWCMHILDNSADKAMKIIKNLRKQPHVTIVIVLPLLFIGISACQNTSAVDPRAVLGGEEKAATDSIGTGDRLYAQRGELSKARSAVTLYRQARTADYGNFEAAWKLARADFYVGSHLTDSASDDAF